MAATAGFGRVDWLAFAITSGATLVVYLLTISPQVKLGFSGIFATAAMHGGVPHPPGYPVAVWWQWLFITLLPVSNIAWRVAVSSAVAAALASGLIALLVARLGRNMIQHPGSPVGTDAVWVRITCGFVAGAIFGFNGALWGRAVIADVWTLSMLLFCGTLCLVMRWCWAPEQKRWLYAGCLAYGLTLTNSQILLAAAPALPALMAIGNRHLARDVLLIGCALFGAGLVEGCPGGISLGFFREGKLGSLLPLHIVIGLLVVTACIMLVVITGRILSEWKALLGCSAAFLFGLTPYLYAPLSSMTNPPMNWGYSRTVGGFLHLVSRGQYENIEPTAELKTVVKQVAMYAAITAKEFGWPSLIVAAVPWIRFRRMSAREQRWMLGLLALYLCLTVLVLAVLNPTDHRDGRQMIKVFFAPSYVVLAVWLGMGLITLAEIANGMPFRAAQKPDS
ncbi:MAG: DUF2723 domain-containing protein [Verrucomicrobia subdivision 3 bacterium]|nr:DUF2723 domain-containing protein [Limisphaerales bacterium]